MRTFVDFIRGHPFSGQNPAGRGAHSERTEPPCAERPWGTLGGALSPNRQQVLQPLRRQPFCCNHVRFFFFALTPIAKSTIMGAKTSTGIGHNTELTSFLIVPASRSESRCYRQGFEEMRSPPLAHDGRAAWPNLEMKSSHRQTTCSLSPLSRFRYANGTRCGRDLLPITIIQYVTQKR